MLCRQRYVRRLAALGVLYDDDERNGEGNGNGAATSAGARELNVTPKVPAFVNRFDRQGTDLATAVAAAAAVPVVPAPGKVVLATPVAAVVAETLQTPAASVQAEPKRTADSTKAGPDFLIPESRYHQRLRVLGVEPVPISVHVACDACLELSTDTIAARTLCGSSGSKCTASLCRKCLRNYFDLQLAGRFAVLHGIPCPASCGQSVPMRNWASHASPDQLARYKKLLLGRVSIRCPSCHKSAPMAGYLVPGSKQATNCTPSDRLDRMVHKNCQDKKTNWFAQNPPQLQRLLQFNDLQAADAVVNAWMAHQKLADETLLQGGESKGNRESEESLRVDAFLADFLLSIPACRMAYRYSGIKSISGWDTEICAALFFAHVRKQPLCRTGCCDAPVCFSCQCKGHHEHQGGSCAKALSVLVQMSDKSFIIRKCPTCKVQLAKTEGCNSVTCPACLAQFNWVSSTAGAEAARRAALARMRGDSSRAPPEGTVVGLYRRTATGWVRFESRFETALGSTKVTE